MDTIEEHELTSISSLHKVVVYIYGVTLSLVIAVKMRFNASIKQQNKKYDRMYITVVKDLQYCTGFALNS